MTIKGQISASLKGNPELEARLNEIAQENECSTHKELIRFLVDSYDNKPQEKKTAPPVGAQPNSIDPQTHFVAQIPKRASKTISDFREDMYNDFQATDDWEILKEVVLIHNQQKAGRKLLIDTAPNLRAAIEDFSKTPIANGEVKDEAQYVGKEVLARFKEKLSQAAKEKKEKEKKPDPAPSKPNSIWNVLDELF